MMLTQHALSKSYPLGFFVKLLFLSYFSFNVFFRDLYHSHYDTCLFFLFISTIWNVITLTNIFDYY